METTETLMQKQVAFLREGSDKIQGYDTLALLPGLMTALTGATLDVAIQLAALRELIESQMMATEDVRQRE